jgi:hypothetical protein
MLDKKDNVIYLVEQETKGNSNYDDPLLRQLKKEEEEQVNVGIMPGYLDLSEVIGWKKAYEFENIEINGKKIPLAIFYDVIIRNNSEIQTIALI